MSEISDLRRRAAAIGCRVRVFRRADYRWQGKRIRYGFIDSLDERYLASLAELRALVKKHERIYAEYGTPNISYGQARARAMAKGAAA